MEFFFYLLLVWLLGVLSLLAIYWRDLSAFWSEPVLSNPVLIIESDDWGAGPLEQADALSRIAAILASYQDSNGNHPVMTIAMILAIPDGPKIESTNRYHRIELDHPDFSTLADAIHSGIELSVFSPQLHGLEHFWPETVMKSPDSKTQSWLRQDGLHATEQLPPHLQSRWINASDLPSVPHDSSLVDAAVQEEVSIYTRVFGDAPLVSVPTTFIWNDDVEKLWSKHGVEFLVTPGCRYTCRGFQGEPSGVDQEYVNNMSGNGMTYLVRDDYFEPEKGHTAGEALQALCRKTRQGRPCLLETHRSNFLGKSAEGSFNELERLLARAGEEYPDICYMNSLELGRAMRDGTGGIIESCWRRRLGPWFGRVEQIPRFYKLATVSGLLALLHAMVKLFSVPEKGVS